MSKTRFACFWNYFWGGVCGLLIGMSDFGPSDWQFWIAAIFCGIVASIFDPIEE
jgi:hypothetical protein